MERVTGVAIGSREQWIPSSSDLAELKAKLTGNHQDFKSFSNYFKKSLAQRNLLINAQTFQHGLDVFLLAVCRRGRLDILRYFLKNHSQHFDINAPIKYVRGSLVDKPLLHSHVSILPRVHGEEEQEESHSSNDLEWHATTLLHMAAIEGFLDMAKTLVSAGACIDSLDCCSETPLLKVIKLSPEATKIARFLIRRGADVNRKGGNSLTALMHVSMLKSKISLELVSILLDAGAKADITDSRGYTAIHIAAAEGNTQVVKHLLACGVDPHFHSSRHLTLQVSPCPLHVADQGMLLAPIYHLLQSKLSNAKNHDYRRLKSMMIGYEENMSAATPPLPTGVTRQFLSHPDCPSTCKADGFLVEVITTVSKWMEGDCEAPILKQCTTQLKEYLATMGRICEIKTDREDPKHEVVTKLHDLLDGEKLSSPFDVVWQCLLLTELVGYGLEGTIHLMLRSCKCLFNWSHYQEALLILQRASFHLLSLIERADYLLAGSESCCTLLIRLLNTILHFIQRYSEKLTYDSWAPLLAATLTNSASSIAAYSQFVSSTHPHLVPLCETELLAKGLLDIVTHWIKLGESEKFLEAVTILVDGCPTVFDSKNRCSTLLHLALRRKNSERLLIALLKCGGKKIVNYMDYTGMRPLHLAAYVQVEHPGRNEPGITFSALLDYGAHIDAVDDGGLTAEQYLLAAADSTHGDLLRALLGHGTIPSLMCLSSQAISSYDICYNGTTLPQHLKAYISCHDSQANRLQSLSVLN